MKSQFHISLQESKRCSLRFSLSLENGWNGRKLFRWSNTVKSLSETVFLSAFGKTLSCLGICYQIWDKTLWSSAFNLLSQKTSECIVFSVMNSECNIHLLVSQRLHVTAPFPLFFKLLIPCFKTRWHCMLSSTKRHDQL